MTKYKVLFEEVTLNVVYVEADSPEEAEKKVECGEFDDSRQVDSYDLEVREVMIESE
jgi:hypothetical protein